MTTLADALDKLAEAIAQTALEIRGLNGATPPAPRPTAPTFDDLPPEDYEDAPPAPAGSAAVCPSHNTAYIKGKFGPFCSATSSEPNWSNPRGFCTITPKNAAAWLRQHA